MRLNHIAAIILRQYFLLRGSMTRIIPLFVWAAIDIILWGFITKFLNSISGTGHDFVPMFLGAILMWDFLVRVMQGTSMAFMEDMWSRNFLNMFASPLTIGEYVSGLVLTSILTSALGLISMILLATLIFGLSVFAYGAMIIPFLFVLFLFGIALGIFGCALLLRLGPAAEWFIWPIPALLSPFACVFYPLSQLPVPMQLISHLLPPMYIFESMRAIVAGHPADISALLISFILVLFYILLACTIYARVYRTAVKTGIISRYSAESIG
jgi:ABC-2 type transport system permease protein